MSWASLDNLPHHATTTPEGDTLWRLVLQHRGVQTPASVAGWKKALDAGSVEPAPTLFLNPVAADRDELVTVYGFPPLTLPPLPADDLLDEALRSTFDVLCEGVGGICRQVDLAEVIASRVAAASPDVVILLVYDGLAYRDAVTWEFPLRWRVRTEPVFVNGLTVTERGMRRVIGDPPLAHRLFEMKYRSRIGCSYWERSGNALARDLFAEFPERQMHRVSDFSEVLDHLRQADLSSPTYVQIIRTGLDHVCHIHRERPDVERLLRQMHDDVVALGTALLEPERGVQLFVTSDHGILWHDGQEVIPFAPAGHRPRYEEGSVTSHAHHLVLQDGSDTFTALATGQVLARSCRATEWGFHGGVSAQESIVPLIELKPV